MSSADSGISVFGPGELGRIFRIQAPYCVVPEWDLAKRYRDLKAAGIFGKHKDPDQLKRMILADSFFTGHEFSWDPGDVTDNKNNEYGIYVLRDFRPPRYFEKVADTFGEFITDFCLGSGYRKFFPEANYESTPDKSYERLFWKNKKKPKK